MITSESRAPSPHTFGKKLTLSLIEGFFARDGDGTPLPQLTPDVLVRSYVPLSRLLVRARTLAYQGGIGTVVFAAGIPQLITPCAPDQFGNAVRVESMGCGAQVERENLLSRSVAIGERFKQRARSWKQKFPLIGDIRGLGGMCAIESVRNPATLESADTEAKAIAKYCYEHGVATIGAGTYNNVLRLLVPGMHVIDAAIRASAAATHISCWHLT